MTRQQTGTPNEEAAAAPRGAVTSVKAGIVTGWVDDAAPGRVLALHIGRRRICTTLPEAAGPGKRAAFTFDAKICPPDLLAGERLAIDVSILGDAAPRLASVAVDTADFLKLSDLPAASQATSFQGCIDEHNASRVRGWAFDEARLERQLELFLFSGDRYLGKYLASQPRPDLAATGRGTGNYGFDIPLRESAEPLTVIVGEPDFWRLPFGAHAIATSARAAPRPSWRELSGSLEAFARALSAVEPFPKKAFVIDKVTRGAVPDAASADYVVLALECLRGEMAASGEAMTGGWRQRMKTWAEMRLIGARIRRLEELAAAIAEGPRLLDVAAQRRRQQNR